ncbi:MAG: hypothetical protein K9H61_13955 [Bacteroidia bacterium]|nr:hypothetical protein [Bacteroidia bacterium]MCF8427483.1 hypothetical protein [Bacteroidia bacterium]MCF8448090.1 hypothetical protein [Bacteroidia bacterium]
MANISWDFLFENQSLFTAPAWDSIKNTMKSINENHYNELFEKYKSK